MVHKIWCPKGCRSAPGCWTSRWPQSLDCRSSPMLCNFCLTKFRSAQWPATCRLEDRIVAFQAMVPCGEPFFLTLRSCFFHPSLFFSTVHPFNLTLPLSCLTLPPSFLTLPPFFLTLHLFLSTLHFFFANPVADACGNCTKQRFRVGLVSEWF